MFSSKVKNTLVFFQTFILLGVANNSFAQLAPDQSLKVPPRLTPTDTANVDVLSGLPSFTLNDLSIGSGVGEIQHIIQTPVEGFYWGFRDSHTYRVQVHTQPAGQTSLVWRAVTVGLDSSLFYPNAGEFKPIKIDGSTLQEFSLADRRYTYEGSNGEVLQHNNPTTVYTEPNGLSWTRYFNTDSQGRKVSVVQNNAGYALVYQYSNANTANRPCYTSSRPNDAKPYCGDNVKDLLFPVKITAVNSSVCVPTEHSCYSDSKWPAVSYEWPWALDVFGYEGYGDNVSYFTVTDNQGRRARYKQERLFSKSEINNLGREWNDYERGVHGVLPQTRITEFEPFESDGVATHIFEYEDYIRCIFVGEMGTDRERCDMRQMIIKEANVNGSRYVYDHTKPNTEYRDAGASLSDKGKLLNVTMDTGSVPTRAFNIWTQDKTATFYENSANHIKTLTVDGVKTEYRYDSRQNIIEVKQKSRDGAGTDLVQSSEYPSSCSNLKVCNKPNWIKDARGNKTVFTYHSESGQLQTITKPAANNGVSPQTRYKYAKFYAKYFDQSGNKTTAASPVWLLTEESYCMKGKPSSSGVGCATSNDEVKTTYSYNTDNLNLTSVAVNAGGKTHLTCMEYDDLGNKIGTTSPEGVVSACN